MRREYICRKSTSQIPSERIGKVTLAIYHDETMAMTAQKTNRRSRVAAYCCSNTEGRAIRCDRRALTLIAKVMP
jgi:hypothetical protein